MLLGGESKNRLSGYLADIIINFIRLAKEKKILEIVARCSEDENSEEYILLKKMLKERFVKSFDNQEMLLAFKEVEILLSNTSRID